MPSYIMEIYVCRRDVRNIFDSFEFDRQDEVEYCHFYALFQDYLLSSKYGGDITLTIILLSEIGSYLLSFLASQNASCKKNGWVHQK